MSSHNNVIKHTDSEDEKLNHDRFISCLEKHGCGAATAAWASIARDLGWSTEEVKVYAFRYFHALQSVEESCDADADAVTGR